MIQGGRGVGVRIGWRAVTARETTVKDLLADINKHMKDIKPYQHMTLWPLQLILGDFGRRQRGHGGRR